MAPIRSVLLGLGSLGVMASAALGQEPAPTTATPVATATPSVRLQSFSVIVPDYDEAKHWYTTRLGFTVVRDQALGADERFILVAAPGHPETGIVLQKARTNRRPDEPNMPTDYSDRIGKTTNIVLLTTDVTAYANALQSRGVALDGPPKQLPWGGQATFKDLYGNSFVIVGPLTAKPAAKDSTRR